MPKRIVIIQGHPDPEAGHLCHALADAYAEGADAGGHAVRRIEVARLDVPLLRSKAAFDSGAPPAPARRPSRSVSKAPAIPRPSLAATRYPTRSVSRKCGTTRRVHAVGAFSRARYGALRSVSTDSTS